MAAAVKYFHINILVIGVDIKGINKYIGCPKIIARMPARISVVQKLRQKSQSNNSEKIFTLAFAIIKSLRPSLPISKMIKLAIHAVMTAIATKLHVSCIVLLLLV